jgi:hypothetical protein
MTLYRYKHLENNKQNPWLCRYSVIKVIECNSSFLNVNSEYSLPSKEFNMGRGARHLYHAEASQTLSQSSDWGNISRDKLQ